MRDRAGQIGKPRQSDAPHARCSLCLMKRSAPFTLGCGVFFACIATLIAKVPSPKEHFGFAIGDDYQLATYTQTEAYFKKVAATSDRVQLVDMGKTEEGRTQWMVVITSPENLKSLARYKEIARKLARAE